MGILCFFVVFFQWLKGRVRIRFIEWKISFVSIVKVTNSHLRTAYLPLSHGNKRMISHVVVDAIKKENVLSKLANIWEHCYPNLSRQRLIIESNGYKQKMLCYPLLTKKIRFIFCRQATSEVNGPSVRVAIWELRLNVLEQCGHGRWIYFVCMGSILLFVWE